ncbi:unnamed protein product [Durusdinium trenchii]|uniref:SAM and basic leucine zipper domain-containing protein 1 (Germ cell-specific ankyrin) n=2 Tax=Durusdinium trenchii TaxID=1381693 RepID=A0ABP0HXG0_9DINO
MCSPSDVCRALPNFDVVLVCDMFVDLPRKLWSPKLDQALHSFVVQGGFLAFVGGEPLAKDRIFKNVFGLVNSWTWHGETGADCIKSPHLDDRIPDMALAPQHLRGRKLMPLRVAKPEERIFVLELDQESDEDSEATEDSSLEPRVVWDLCGVSLTQQGFGSLVNLGEMRSFEGAWWDALVCLVEGHAAKPPLLEAMEIALSQGVATVEDDDAKVIRMEALVDDAFEAVLNANEAKLRDLLRLINPNMVAEHGFSLLMHAAQTSEVTIMRLLLNARADVNQVDEDNGWSALHYMADSPRCTLEGWSFLIESGADETLRSQFGDSPMDIARENRFLRLRHRHQPIHAW